ncbi:MAG: GGDEF domain-containing protein [Pseudomonadota bacterium]|nr:GGDEF domain-containing protein [Pseudomonadota bacterium]
MDNAVVIGLTVPAISTCICTIFLGFWHYNRNDRSALRFAAAFALFALGFTTNHFVLAKDTIANAIVHNAFYASGLFALLDGMHRAFSRKTPVTALASIGVGSVIGALLIQLSPAELSQRILWVNTLQATSFLISCVTLWGIWRNTWTGTATYAALALATINSMAIAPYNIMRSTITEETFFDTLYWGTMNVLATLTVLSMGGALITVCVMQRLGALKENADQDYLTGLMSRRAFEEAARDYCKSRSGQVAASLIIIDIDHFKSINDEYGHTAGDQVIRRLGAFLSSQTRSSDLVGRLGGEEFCLLLPGTDTNGARMLASRLRDNLAKVTFDGLPATRRVTASFGVAELGLRTAFADIYPMADAALYSAKARGRDRIVCRPAPEDAGEPIRRERFHALPDGSRTPSDRMVS